MENNTIKWKKNFLPKSEIRNNTDILSLSEVCKAKEFHQSFPEYSETPLVKLDNFAKHIGLRKFFIKDESFRFGLNAFKVLGGSYSMGKYMAQRLGKDITELGYKEFISKEIKSMIGEITFYTATDGNHGRGVAWTANRLGQKSVVYMPKGSSQFRLQAIRNEGAEAMITDMNYDDVYIV